MNPEDLRRRLHQAVVPVAAQEDPAPAIQQRANSIARRRVTATTCALVLAVASAALVSTHRSGSEPTPGTPVATSVSGFGGGAQAGLLPKTGGKYLIEQTTMKIDLPTTPVLYQWRQQPIGQAQPRDAIWLLARCAETSAQVVVALHSEANTSFTQYAVPCSTKTQVPVPSTWSSGARADLSVGVGSAGEVVVEAGLYRADYCRAGECWIT
ncbi:hypothetical protein [Kribbella italica]|uniref:Uncharacterized protein n=1 Tax=Kribbella italica TaxID=1540520 RepID=A0A7W9JC26_9ACTN|nr:hypothetical protein [Kribbella italica]MBB5839407.1 hypothetical protein [Kribbella italica]